MDQSTDFSLFPAAYGILANDRLMHPVDLADWPLKIDSGSPLFLDDYLIAENSGVKRSAVCSACGTTSFLKYTTETGLPVRYPRRLDRRAVY